MSKPIYSFLIFLSFLLFVVAMYGPHYFELPDATIGAWGDFMGGIIGLLALIWLVAGQLANQIEINETKKDLRDQLELTRSAVGALTRIASGTQVQAAAALAEAEPRFVCLGSAGQDIQDGVKAVRSVSGYINFENLGGPVELLAVSSSSDEIKVDGIVGMCNTGSRFQLKIHSVGTLKSVGEIRIKIDFEDKFKRQGWVDIGYKSFDSAPSINVQMGKQ